MQDDFESPLDKIIREARQRGEFDHLPGAGRPIRWEDESLIPEDQRLANRVQKNNGFVPDWVAAAQELKKEYAAARRTLEQARQQRGQGRLSHENWQAAREAFSEAARRLNLRLIGVNMRVPHEQVALLPFPTDPDAAEG